MPGDYLTHDYSGMPLLLVRQLDGSLRAFLNVCRHRGARLANGTGKGVRDLICPYHGWCYGTDDKLLVRADDPSFAEIDKSARGLCELMAVEKYGRISVELMRTPMSWRDQATDGCDMHQVLYRDDGELLGDVLRVHGGQDTYVYTIAGAGV